MSEILTTEPSAVTAGDTIHWQIALPDYPASAGWVLKYVLLCAAGRIEITAEANGDDHLVTIEAGSPASGATPASGSCAWGPGTYVWQRYVEKEEERYTLGSGSTEVRKGFLLQSSAIDTRSFIKKTLDALEAVLEGRAGRSDLEYTIDTGTSRRTLKSMPTADLLKMRDEFSLRYWRELNPGKLCPQISLTARRLNHA